MKSYLNFLAERKQIAKTRTLITEAFRKEDVQNAWKSIDTLLKKKIDGKVVALPTYFQNSVDGKSCTSRYYLVASAGDGWEDAFMFTFSWLNTGESTELYAVDFYRNTDLLWKGEAKTALTVYPSGASIVQVLPIIYTVCNEKTFKLTEDEANMLSKRVFKGGNVSECKIQLGVSTYIVKEGLTSDEIIEAIADTEARQMLRDKSKEISTAKKEGDAEKVKQLAKEYRQIGKAIADGAITAEDVQIAIAANIKVRANDEEDKKHDEELQEYKKDPAVAFKEMNQYVNMVCDGLTPSVIICGAPGLGKTYKIKRALKAKKYEEGKNMLTFKAKASARALYCALYNYQDKGDLLVIDDADCLVGPKAPEDCINILKAALDSTSDDEGKLVTYGITGKIFNEDGEELPKRFYYRGSCIIITNYTAGQLDTALRGRSYVQDISFTQRQILEYIHSLLPELGKDAGYTDEDKQQSYDYLEDLCNKKAKIVLDFRTFGICCSLFAAARLNPDDMSAEMAQSMIAEQMRNRFASGGKKY